MTPDKVDEITKAISSGEYPWCRARLMHALTSAIKQNVLGDLLDELLGEEGIRTEEKIKEYLYWNGWLI